MDPNRKTNRFYMIMAIVCAVMAVLVQATANEKNFGGLPFQRMIVVVLAITSVAFTARLVPVGDKSERRKNKGE